MSGGNACNCGERNKPVRERRWFVSEYKWNNGAFVKNGGEPSLYSSVWCSACGSRWRTMAGYVEHIGAMTIEEILDKISNKEVDD